MNKSIKELLVKAQLLQSQLEDPTIINSKKYSDIAKEYSDIKEFIPDLQKISDLDEELIEAKNLLESTDDPIELDLYNNIITLNTSLIDKLTKPILKTLLSSSTIAKAPSIIEVRAGTGGEEASLFAADLVRMYFKYCESQAWEIEIISTNHTTNGGYKEFVFIVNNKQSYPLLLFENGVHRVQRVPTTESSGRIHTSAASVVVLPLITNIDINISESDLKIDTYRSSGPGGQSVNTTDSAVRITHIPTGVVVTCQDQKSQLKNKAKAMTILKSKIFEQKEQEKQKQATEQRKSAIKSGDRSDKIRTYNYPQSRITDHRISKSWQNLDKVMDGYLDEIIATLIEDYRI